MRSTNGSRSESGRAGRSALPHPERVECEAGVGARDAERRRGRAAQRERHGRVQPMGEWAGCRRPAVPEIGRTSTRGRACRAARSPARPRPRGAASQRTRSGRTRLRSCASWMRFQPSCSTTGWPVSSAPISSSARGAVPFLRRRQPTVPRTSRRFEAGVGEDEVRSHHLQRGTGGSGLPAVSMKRSASASSMLCLITASGAARTSIRLPQVVAAWRAAASGTRIDRRQRGVQPRHEPRPERRRRTGNRSSCDHQAATVVMRQIVRHQLSQTTRRRRLRATLATVSVPPPVGKCGGCARR